MLKKNCEWSFFLYDIFMKQIMIMNEVLKTNITFVNEVVYI